MWTRTKNELETNKNTKKSFKPYKTQKKEAKHREQTPEYSHPRGPSMTTSIVMQPRNFAPPARMASTKRKRKRNENEGQTVLTPQNLWLKSMFLNWLMQDIQGKKGHLGHAMQNTLVWFVRLKNAAPAARLPQRQRRRRRSCQCSPPKPRLRRRRAAAIAPTAAHMTAPPLWSIYRCWRILFVTRLHAIRTEFQTNVDDFRARSLQVSRLSNCSCICCYFPLRNYNLSSYGERPGTPRYPFGGKWPLQGPFYVKWLIKKSKNHAKSMFYCFCWCSTKIKRFYAPTMRCDAQSFPNYQFIWNIWI